MKNLKLTNKIILICVGIYLSFGCNTAFADDTVWTRFVEAKNNGTALPIPDFSYAGYKNGEVDIPSPNWVVFDVTRFGATPDDNGDDLAAVRAAISAAQNAKGGIVFFPKGRYLLSEQPGITETLIRISGSDIILRGEGSGVGGTELFFREKLISTTPERKWTTPSMMIFEGTSSGHKGDKVTTVSSSAKIGGFSFEVADTGSLSAGDHIVINLLDPAAANNETLKPYEVEDNWSRFKTGEFAREYHQIESIEGNRITLKMPLCMDIDEKYNWEIRKISLARNLGIEKMAFVGNWTIPFEHHKDVFHDSAWTAMSVNKYADSWVKDVRFKDWNQTLKIGSSHSISVIKVVETGNRGHQSMLVENSYGVLVTHSHDRVNQGQFHAMGVASWAAATVFHRSSWPKETSFDSHASFPHATLFDRIDGGFSGASGGSGGSDAAQPNHMRDLILWNFKDLGDNDGITKDWWRTDSIYGRFLMPKLFGWHGARADFDESQLGLNESFGDQATPESLYEAQLKLRLGELPEWLVNLNSGKVPAPTPTPEPPPLPQTPFKKHIIPGKIQAEDFDYGGEGVAYHDSNPKNFGDVFSRGNGVDIQETSDISGGANIGWVKNGEWLEYTVKDVEEGQYDISVRYASRLILGRKSLTFKLGDEDLATIKLRGTGGSQRWKTATAKNINIESGSDVVLRISAKGSYFNINWIEFSKSSSRRYTPQLITGHSIISVTNEQSTNPASNLYDNDISGDVGTRWSGKGLRSGPLTVVMDMGRYYRITKTELFPWLNRDYKYTFSISNSIDGDYTTIVDRSENESSEESFIDEVSGRVTGRYLRLQVTGAATYGGDWASISEIKVTGVRMPRWWTWLAELKAAARDRHQDAGEQ